MPATACLFVLAAFAQAPAGERGVTIEELRAYERWLEAYGEGKILFTDDRGRFERKNWERCRRLFAAAARTNDLDAARRLWPAAVVELPANLSNLRRLEAQPMRVRALARRLIAAIEDPRLDGWLLKKLLVRGSAPDKARTREAALDVIGRRGSKGMGRLLLKSLSRFPAAERAGAVLALEKLGTPEALPVLTKLLRARDPNLRIAAVQAAAGILAPLTDETRDHGAAEREEAARLLPVLLDGLRRILLSDRVWQVRAAAVDGLVRLRVRAAIPILIEGFATELRKGGREAMLAHAYDDALRSLTGQDLPEGRPDLWREFWRREGSRLRLARKESGPKGGKPARDAPAYVRYFNIRVLTRKLLFVVDFSGSMAEKVKLGGRYAREGARPKYEIVKRELERVVRALPRTAVCNVVFFNDRVAVWRRGRDGRPAAVKMTDEHKSDLLQYIYETRPKGATNVYAALKTALGLGGRGVYDRFYDTAYDTIYFLSDGAPTAGETTDTGEILRMVRRANKLKRIRIHTIVFGNEMNNLTFMKALAEQNGGRFLKVE